MPRRSSTLTTYGIGVSVVLAVVNGIAALVAGAARRHDIGVYSGGFLMGMLGTCIAAYLYGYRRVR